MSLGREIKEAIGAFGAVMRIDNERRRTNAYEEIAKGRGNNTGLPSQSVLDKRYKEQWGQLPPGARPPGVIDRIRGAFGGGASGGGGSGATVWQGSVDPNAGTLPAEPVYDTNDAGVSEEDGGDVQGYSEGGVVERLRALGASRSPMPPQYSEPLDPRMIQGPTDPGPWASRPSPDGAGTVPFEGVPQFGPEPQTVAPDAPPMAPAEPRGPRVSGPSPDGARTAAFEGVPKFEGAEPPDRSGGVVPARADVAPKGNATGGSKSGAKRKALRDQTRTEAYDPVLDKDDPDNMIRLAINGAMDFANDTFHLKGDKIDAIGTPDPHTKAGRAKFLGGTGAAPEGDIQELNRVAAETAPDKKLLAADPNVRDSIIGLRRLAIVYEHFVQTGQTDKANKAAFEIIQYSAVKASEYGTQAKQALAAGDTERAKQLVARAYSQVPDGNHMVISPDGRTAIIRGDDGKTVDQYTITPQNLLQAALGLSNKSMFWEVLHNRANSVGKNKAKEPTELDKARIENLKARTAVVQKKLAGGGGGGAAAPTPSPVAGILEDLQRATGITTPNPSSGGEGSQPASPTQKAEATNDSGDPGGDPDVQAMDGTNPVGQGGEPLPTPPASMLRLNKPSPAQATALAQPTPNAAVTPEGKPAKFDPEGKDYDEEAAKAAGLKPDADGHWPSRDPKSGRILKGRNHETFAKTIEGENKAGYQIFKGKDGYYYSIMDNEAVPDEIVHDGKKISVPVFTPPKYDVEHPGAKLAGTRFEGSNPYSKVLQDAEFRKWVAANTKNKLGPQELARVQNMEREYNNKVKAWETGKKAFEREYRDAHNKEQTAAIAEAKRVYDRSLSTRELQELPAEINVHAETLRDSKSKSGASIPSIWNAPDEVAKPEELKELATNLFTSNRNMTPAMSARMVAELTTPGTEEKERQFMPVGKDRAGNVVVRLKGDDSVEVHIRPGAYKKINRITERYREHLLKPKDQPKEKSWGDIGTSALDVVKKLPDYVTNNEFNSQAPKGSGIVSDIARAQTYPLRAGKEFVDSGGAAATGRAMAVPLSVGMALRRRVDDVGRAPGPGLVERFKRNFSSENDPPPRIDTPLIMP